MTALNIKRSTGKKIAGFFVLLFLCLGILTPAPVSAQVNTGGTNPQAQNAGGASSKDGVTCAIEKIGWILCPLMEGVAKAADMSYAVLANNFLQIEPELLSAKPAAGAGTITAWEYARNIANVAFIIAFLVIIYSQVTGAGLNNYGIKRMLPRLIIAAIAVNISYYICQAMVDVSNILGFEVKGALEGVAKQIGPLVMAQDPQAANTQTSSGGLGILSKITIAVLAVGAVVWIFTGLMGSIGLLVLITVLTVIAILLLRKAFIVILVVLSPLAFVAYLLPNTEKYFSKWLNMFWQLLMVFPIVALLFGGGQLASTTILVAGASANATQQAQTQTQNCQNAQGATPTVPPVNNGYNIPCEEQVEIGSGNNKKPAGWMLGLVAAGIAIAPLLFVWSVLKGALAAAGAIGGKISNAIQDASKGKRNDLMGKYKEDKDRRKQNRDIRALQGTPMGKAINVATLGSARRNARRRANVDRTKARYNEAYLGYVADSSVKTKDGQPVLDQNGNPELTRFGRQLAGGVTPFGLGSSQGGQMRAASDAVNAMRELEIKNVKAAHATIDSLDETQLKNVIGSAKDKNDPQLAAALERMAKIGDKKTVAGYADAVGKGGSSLASRSLGAALAGEGYLKSRDIDEISRGAMGNEGFEQRVLQNINDGIYSPDSLANAGKAELDFVHQIAGSSGHVGARSALNTAASKAMLDERLKIKLNLGWFYPT